MLQEAPNSIETATQPACGMFFLELYSDSELGFPVPKGCYFNFILISINFHSILDNWFGYLYNYLCFEPTMGPFKKEEYDFEEDEEEDDEEEEDEEEGEEGEEDDDEERED